MSNSQNEENDHINTYTSMFLNNRGKKIFCRYWEPKGKPRALVFVIHGFAEHCQPYDSLARNLVSLNFFVFAHDHVGHGQSGGSRVHIDDFHNFIEDVFQHAEMMKKKFPGIPMFLCGHSMGGAISILAALEKPEEFRGIVLIAPCIAVNPELATPLKLAVARMLRRFLPHFGIGSLDLSQISRSPDAVKVLKEDPLRWHGRCKAGLAVCLIGATREIQDKTSSIKFPLLILQGDADMICQPQAAVEMYEKCSSKDKIMKIYPKAYHGLLIEPYGIAEQVKKDIADWLAQRT